MVRGRRYLFELQDKACQHHCGNLQLAIGCCRAAWSSGLKPGLQAAAEQWTQCRRLGFPFAFSTATPAGYAEGWAASRAAREFGLDLFRAMAASGLANFGKTPDVQ